MDYSSSVQMDILLTPWKTIVLVRFGASEDGCEDMRLLLKVIWRRICDCMAKDESLPLGKLSK